MERKLAKIYFDPSHPAGFAGASLLKKYVKSVNPKDVTKWLQSQDTYTLHKPLTRKFKRNRYLLNNIDQLWQADLNDMRGLSKHNDGVNYLLAVIDVFSKYGFMVSLKNKTGMCIINAFRTIFKTSGRIPESIQTDKGSEFTSKDVSKFFKVNGIHYFTTRNPDIKASIVERWNRTIKSRMWRYLTHNNTYRYIDVIDNLVQAYNNTLHSTIKMAPVEVNDGNILQVWQNAYAKKETYLHPKFQVGDTVRITKEKKYFEKGYETKWSEELFKVIKVIKHPKPVYQLKDLSGEIIDGYFYEPEMQSVRDSKNKDFKINKILATRGKGRSKKYLVSWKGYPTKFNSWILASSVKSV